MSNIKKIVSIDKKIYSLKKLRFASNFKNNMLKLKN